MSRLWNMAYVLAYHPQAYANHVNGLGRRIVGWCVHVPRVSDVTGNVTWHFPAATATQAWRAAAEAVENRERKRGSPYRSRVDRTASGK